MFATSFVLGYHGCDRVIGEKILSGDQHVKTSTNRYDWLGTGSYFWENSPSRAMEWAGFLRKNPPHHLQKIAEPFVVGAIIDLGNCLDLSDASSLKIVRGAYDQFKKANDLVGTPLPTNEPAVSGDLDLVKRHLDCAVINFVHALRKKGGEREFDTVRAPFNEGKELYPGAKIMNKTHVQICVRNPGCIKAYFRPRYEG